LADREFGADESRQHQRGPRGGAPPRRSGGTKDRSDAAVPGDGLGRRRHAQLAHVEASPREPHAQPFDLRLGLAARVLDDLEIRSGRFPFLPRERAHAHPLRCKLHVGKA